MERITRIKPPYHHVAVAVDDRQQVVEIVRYAPRQPSHALQFLCLPELLLQLPSFGDVERYSDESHSRSLRIEIHPAPGGDPSHEFIRDAQGSKLSGILSIAAMPQDIFYDAFRSFPIFRVNSVPQSVPSDDRVGWQSEMLLGHIRPDQCSGLRRKVESSQMRRLDREGQSFFRLPALSPGPGLPDLALDHRNQACHLIF